MKTLAKFLAFASLALFCTSPVHGQAKAISTLTCTQDDGPSLTLPVYAYTFSANTTITRFFTVYTDISRLNSLLIDLYFVSTYTNCSLSGDSGLLLSVITMEDVDASGSAAGVQTANAQAYTSVTFSGTFLSVSDSARKAAFKPQTEAEKAKALADFKTRGLALPK